MNDEITGDLDEIFEARMREVQFQRYLSERSRRQLRLYIALAICGAMIIALFVVLKYREELGLNSSFVPIAAIATAVTALSGALLAYLQPSSFRDRYASYLNPYQLREYAQLILRDAVDDLKRDGVKALEFTEADRASLVAAMHAKLAADATGALVAEMKQQMLIEAKEAALDGKLDQMRRRLSREILDLGRRGNVNLVLGMGTTIAGVSVLAYAVFKPPTAADTYQLIAHYGPRLSLVVLIEVFAYFFLRLYKDSLQGIKYFQNELTNIESKSLALQVASGLGEREMIGKVIEQLAATERNPVGQPASARSSADASGAATALAESLRDVIQALSAQSRAKQ